jgi:UDP-galactopyranose mutase
MDYVVLSHLRWDWVFQRPQHLMSQCARNARVFFVEEPHFGAEASRLEVTPRGPNIWVAAPHLPESERETLESMPMLLQRMLAQHDIRQYCLWYYTPMALAFSRHLKPMVSVYDCMDELSAFRNAPPRLRAAERELFGRVDLVFTGGQSLYESKRHQHERVYAFPSSVDTEHFRQARGDDRSPADQARLAHPRIGYYGVIDERIDLALLDEVAMAHRDWHFIMVGPVCKVDPADLPRGSNLHYLGQKQYEELPLYLSGWDVAMMPFAMNESTRFISPTKTPEYLAGGRPVVSTPIRDVVVPYGDEGLVHIAATADEFAEGIARALTDNRDELVKAADAFLTGRSWSDTWRRMELNIQSVIARSGAAAM